MEWMIDTISQERSRLFVGRAREMEMLQTWIDTTQSDTSVWAIVGLAGMGKSSLIMEMMRVARQAGLNTLWIDGRSSPHTPVGFLHDTEELVRRHFGVRPADPGSGLEILTAHRTILAIDNFDDIDVLDGWFREDFLPRLPNRGVLILLGTRHSLSEHWFVDGAWRQRVVNFSLGPLSLQERYTYAQHAGIELNPETRAVIQRSKGHPLSLALNVEVIKQSLRESKTLQNFSETITADLMREVTDPELQPLLDVLTILPAANHELISQILANPVQRHHYQALSRLSFVHPVREGLALHDIARTHLRLDLQTREPSRVRTLRARAIDHLSRQYYAADEASQKNLIAFALLHIFSQCLSSNHLYADLTAFAEVNSTDGVHPADLPTLHGFLDQWGRQSLELGDIASTHRLLDEIADRFPESFRVLRLPSGQILAFAVALLLYRETADLIDRYAEGILHRYFPEQQDRFVFPVSQADTYLQILVGINTECIEYTREEILGLLIKDGLSYLRTGLRIAMVITQSHLKALLAGLGFQGTPIEHLDLKEEIQPELFSLDLRHRDLPAWLSSLMPPLIENTHQTDNLADISEQRVRRALAVIHNPRKLQAVGLAQQMGLSVAELQKLLSILLTDNPVAPLTKRTQSSLRLAFLDTSVNLEQAAASLYMSRSTFYRQVRLGIEALTVVLTGQEHLR